jgi:YgiT-type zinc finger domain-containing protein
MKKFLCEKCGNDQYKSKMANFPLDISGKTIFVDRVSVRECLKCRRQHPTTAGTAKINRCLSVWTMLGNRNSKPV